MRGVDAEGLYNNGTISKTGVLRRVIYVAIGLCANYRNTEAVAVVVGGISV